MFDCPDHYFEIGAQVGGEAGVQSPEDPWGRRGNIMNRETPVQPTLEALMAGYVRRQAEAEALGLGHGEGAEVTPYEAAPVQPIDPKLAWEEGLAVLSYFGSATKGFKAPTGWAQLV